MSRPPLPRHHGVDRQRAVLHQRVAHGHFTRLTDATKLPQTHPWPVSSGQHDDEQHQQPVGLYHSVSGITNGRAGQQTTTGDSATNCLPEQRTTLGDYTSPYVVHALLLRGADHPPGSVPWPPVEQQRRTVTANRGHCGVDRLLGQINPHAHLQRSAGAERERLHGDRRPSTTLNKILQPEMHIALFWVGCRRGTGAAAQATPTSKIRQGLTWQAVILPTRLPSAGQATVDTNHTKTTWAIMSQGPRQRGQLLGWARKQ